MWEIFWQVHILRAPPSGDALRRVKVKSVELIVFLWKARSKKSWQFSHQLQIFIYLLPSNMHLHLEFAKGKMKKSVCWPSPKNFNKNWTHFYILTCFNSFKSGGTIHCWVVQGNLEWHSSRAKVLSSAWMSSVQVCMVARWSIQVVEYSTLLTTQPTLKTRCWKLKLGYITKG
jgi:hypothetical protein